MIKKNQGVFIEHQKTLPHVIMALAFISSMACYSQAAAQEKCTDAVTEVQSLYEVGRTSEMIVLLNSCLPDSIPEEVEKIQAYKFLSLAYIAEDFLSEAKDAVEKMLDINENLEPDHATDPSQFIEFVTDAKKIRSQKKSKKKRWLYIGGGTVLAGVVTAAIVYAAGGSDGKAVRLPDPPTFPDNQ